MVTTDTGATATGLSIAGILSSVPLGVPLATIFLGTAFAIVGVIGRAAFDMQKSLEAGDRIKGAQVLGWVGAGLVGAPFTAVLWIVLLRAVGAQTDLATVIGLLFLGFTGPKGVTWAMGFVTDFLKAKLPGAKPPG